MVEAATNSRNASRLFAGLVVIALGAIALLDNFNIVRIGNVWPLWPLILIAVGLAKLLRPRGSPGRFAGTLLSGAGLWLLLENLGVWRCSLGDLWPLFVVALGCFLPTLFTGARPPFAENWKTGFLTARNLHVDAEGRRPGGI